MDFDFLEAKSGDKTCSCNGIFLHSKYNPRSEGEKFAQTLQADFSPLCILIVEAGLSYCAPFLRAKFPNAKLCTIRFCDSFKETDSLWDFVFYGADENFSNLSEDLFNALGEEILISTIAADWIPAKNAFSQLNLACWNQIKKATLKARDVIGTRAYFSKRWVKNAIQFAKKIRNVSIPAKTNLPVIVAASGPSLETSLPYLKELRDSFYLIAVSSAFKVLNSNGISPDLVLSSDGGFWAKRHLSFPGQRQTDAVFGIEAEGAVFSSLYENQILPLAYEDGFERELLEAINCPYLLSRRNGTIAGTALEFALSFTDSSVYVCGFDQAPVKGFQHTQPNALENISAIKDSRLSPKEKRMTSSRFNSAAALEIYRNWFISNSKRLSERTKRLSDNFRYDFSLGEIQEADWQDFKKECLTDSCPAKSSDKKIEVFEISSVKKERKKIILQTLEKMMDRESFLQELFPLELLLIKRESDSAKKSGLASALQQKKHDFIEDVKIRF